MDDKNKKWGGARNGAGAKKKEQSQSLVERLKPYDDSAFKALSTAIVDQKDWAIKLFFQYRYGLPKQIVDENPNADKEIIIKRVD